MSRRGSGALAGALALAGLLAGCGMPGRDRELVEVSSSEIAGRYVLTGWHRPHPSEALRAITSAVHTGSCTGATAALIVAPLVEDRWRLTAIDPGGCEHSVELHGRIVDGEVQFSRTDWRFPCFPLLWGWSASNLGLSRHHDGQLLVRSSGGGVALLVILPLTGSLPLSHTELRPWPER